MPSWIAFSGPGVYAIYIGGAYLLVLIALTAEIALVVLRHRNIRHYLADGAHDEPPAVAPREAAGAAGAAARPGARS